jgi:hypothetical protein
MHARGLGKAAPAAVLRYDLGMPEVREVCKKARA